MAKKKYYAVVAGRKPGIYTDWFGPDGARAQVIGFQGAIYKGFATRKEAQAFMNSGPSAAKLSGGRGHTQKARPVAAAPPDADDRVVIYTDGSSLGNPGPGGYGVVIPSDNGDRELSGGFRRTTNNRMELLACIVGLEQFRSPAAVALYSDSRYVVDGITKGWAKNWRRSGWRKSNGSPALNPDLWERLLALCERHNVAFIWVKGHAGHPGNERCDQLATQAAARSDLPPDEGYRG
jgi:ribonuclease HI